MKSRITIDIADDNQPVIRIEYQESEDVRDKLVKRFLETFGGESTFANFYYINVLERDCMAEIRPLSPPDTRNIRKIFYEEQGRKEIITVKNV